MLERWDILLNSYRNDGSFSVLFMVSKEVFMKEKELVPIDQFHVTFESLEEVDELVKLLKSRGYTIYHNLENVLSFERLPVGLCVDNGTPYNGGKCIFQSNSMCMHLFQNRYRVRPLKTRELIDNIDKLIDNPDIDFYNSIVERF